MRFQRATFGLESYSITCRCYFIFNESLAKQKNKRADPVQTYDTQFYAKTSYSSNKSNRFFDFNLYSWNGQTVALLIRALVKHS